jgi:hypothetical protein
MDEKLEGLIDDVFKFMKGKEPNTDDYGKAVRNLKELYGMRKVEPEPVEKVRDKINPQVIAILGIVVPALTSIIGIGMIIHHEELNVITTKALSFVMRGRF